MSTTVRRFLAVCSLAPLGCVLAIGRHASADNFGDHYYDSATNQLVVTVLYGGTDANHKFTLKWDACEFDDSGRRLPWTNADMLDDQFNDTEKRQYKVVVRLSLADMPCPRPAIITVSTAPGYSFKLVLPK
ncbi:MAG: hypothetical protein WB646_17820 [Steroidobacteraceae bacterium]